MKNQTGLIDTIRMFNRLYTVKLGVLNKTFLESYSLAETRILYELLTNDGCMASDLAKLLCMDKSYLSRILSGLVKKGLLLKSASPSDGRAFHLHLTASGRLEAEKLVSLTNQQISDMLSAYSDADCQEIQAAMHTLLSYFERENKQ